MKNRIFFLCPNNKFVSGGVKQIYRQVEILKKNGFDAYVLHQKKGKKDVWFNNSAPIKYSPYIFKLLKYLYKENEINILKKLNLCFLKANSIKLNYNDIIVLPEIYGPKSYEIYPDNKKIVFNQNCYYTFDYFNLNTDNFQNIYNSKNTIATIVASFDAYNYLSYTFPNQIFYRIILGIDRNIFYYSQKKRKQICYMPRKLSDDVKQVINILKFKGVEKDWDLVPIDNKTEQEVAKIMRESTIFLSFNHREGFGLPPAEAMACGCYVIGYTGQGGKEYFKSEFSLPVEDGNILSFVKNIENSLKIYELNQNLILEKGKIASQFIEKHYNLEKEKEEILKIWKKILNIF